MTITLRQIAVSGGAAVALLGGAAAITTAVAPPVSAATQTTVEKAITAPVQLPDGRTMRITGMGGYGHHATTDHITTVTAVAYNEDRSPNSITTGITPDNGVTELQNPMNTPQQPAGVTQQVTTQAAGGGAIGVGIVTILILAIIVFYKVKHGGMKTADAVLGGLFGIALSGTVIGAMGSQLTNSLVGSLGTMLGGLG